MLSSRALLRSVPSITRSFHTSIVPQSEKINWSSITTVFTPAAQVAEWKDYDNRLNSLRSELVGAPKEVLPIDWSHWEKVIQDKNTLKQIREEYENTKYPDAKESDLAEINAKLDRLVANGEKNVDIHQAEINRYKEILALQEEFKVAQHEMTLEEIILQNKYFPGLGDQTDEDYINDEWYPTPEEEALGEDPNEFRKQLSAGQIRTIDIEEAGLSNFRFGSFSVKDEFARVEALNDKLYGDLPEYRAAKAARAAAAEKRRKEKEAKQHDHHEDEHENYL